MTANGLRPLAGALENRSRDAIGLCYHSIAAPGPDWTSVPPDLFERQLDALRRRGYRAAGTEHLAGMAAGGRLDARRALLTFDDGYVDNYTTALPLLREYGFRGIVFLLPPYVDSGAPFDWPEVADRQLQHPDVMRSMDWSQAGEMAEAGCEFGSHGLTHRHLPDLSDADLRDELADSKRQMEERLGKPCPLFVYPFGEWDRRVAEAAADTGYEWAFTLPYESQRDTTPMTLPRIAVDQRDSRWRFELKLQPQGRRLLLSPLKTRLRRVLRRS